MKNFFLIKGNCFCDNLSKVNVLKFGYTSAELYAQWHLAQTSLRGGGGEGAILNFDVL